MSSRDWDAGSYERVAGGVIALGHEVLDRLALRGDESVLDAGCGPGHVTAALAERLPEGRVIAVDASPSMVAAARERLAPVLAAGRARVEVADLLEFDPGEPLDAVLSTATFHWIGDHDRLFARLRAALRPGGRLVAQCGGAGNIARARRTIAAAARDARFRPFVGDFDPWTFAGAAETEQRLLAAGFREARCWLEPRPVTAESPPEYFATVMLVAHLEQLPDPLREPFVAAVVEGLPAPVEIDYVRLNVEAVA